MIPGPLSDAQKPLLGSNTDSREVGSTYVPPAGLSRSDGKSSPAIMMAGLGAQNEAKGSPVKTPSQNEVKASEQDTECLANVIDYGLGTGLGAGVGIALDLGCWFPVYSAAASCLSTAFTKSVFKQCGCCTGKATPGDYCAPPIANLAAKCCP